MDSSTLTDSQKLFYLKGLLTGEASRLLASVTVTDANYEVAKEMLISRYDNRRAIVREHLSKIIHATPVTKQDPTALRSIWQGVDEQRRALTALGIQSHDMDIYTIHLVVDKLDTESRRQWELAHPGTGILTYLQLSEFLTTRCRALESSHSSKVGPTPQGSNFGQTSSRTQAQQTRRNQTYAAAQTSKSKCPKCNSGEHELYGCSSFKELTLKAEKSSYKKANCASTA